MLDETESKLVTSGKGNDSPPELKVESLAKEGDNDDAVTEASDSNNQQEMKTRNGRIGCILKKYDVFNMLPPKDD